MWLLRLAFGLATLLAGRLPYKKEVMSCSNASRKYQVNIKIGWNVGPIHMPDVMSPWWNWVPWLSSRRANFPQFWSSWIFSLCTQLVTTTDSILQATHWKHCLPPCLGAYVVAAFAWNFGLEDCQVQSWKVMDMMMLIRIQYWSMM